jgi:CBS-domain-containing membrane protein
MNTSTIKVLRRPVESSLYITVAIVAILGGVVFVEYTLSHSVSSWPTLIKAASLLLVAYALYWLARRSKPGTVDESTLEGGTADPLSASGEAR